MEKLAIQDLQKKFSQAIACKKVYPQLLEAIIPGGHLETAEEALFVYSRAYKARLTEVLGETFEAVWSILGDDDFFILAESYISCRVSASYNLSDYGEHIPSFLEKTSWIKRFPFLADLARFEWNFKAVFHELASANAFKNALKVKANSQFRFESSVKLMKSPFSVYKIWQDRKKQNTCHPSKIDDPEHLLLYKGNDDKIWVVYLRDWQFDLLVNLYHGKTLNEALNAMLFRYHLTDASLVEAFFAKIAAYSVIASIDDGSQNRKPVNPPPNEAGLRGESAQTLPHP